MNRIKNFFIVMVIVLLCGVGLTCVDSDIFDIIYNKKSFSAYTEAGFNDENFYKCVVDSYNAISSSKVTYDSTISAANLAKVTKASCQQKGIKDLTGIEKLTGLTELNLSNTDPNATDANKITSINTSKNVKLNSLYLSGVGLAVYDANENSAAIATLDLSNNKINKISFAEDSKLINFTFDNNAYSFFKKLDLSSETLLKVVSIKNNAYLNEIVFPDTVSISELKIDITDNAKLSNISLPTNITTTSTSAVSTLNISDNGKNLGTDILNIVMPNKIISKNTSTAVYPTITINNNKNLNSIKTPIIVNASDAVVVSKLVVTGNPNLSSIDFTQTVGAKYVDVNINPLLTEVLFPAFTTLSELNINENGKDLASNKKLEIKFPYTIDGTPASPVYPKIKVTGDATININNNSNIEKIVFPYISSGTSATININNNKGLKNINSLLNVSFEYTDEDNINKYSSVIKSIINIQNNAELESIQLPDSSNISLDVTNNLLLTNIDLKGSGVTNLVVKSNPKLIGIDNPKLETPMSAIVNDNKMLKSLFLNLSTANLSNNALETLDLSKSSTLTEANISNNKLISLVFTDTPNISKIDASYNLLTSIVLPSSKKVTSLNLNNNKLTSEGIENLSVHTGMTYLNLSNNELSQNLDFTSFRKIVELYFDNNSGNISSITLANKTSTDTPDLKILHITNSSSLESIENLTANTGLVNITISNNSKLSSLNLSSNKEAVSIEVINNSMLKTLKLPAGAANATVKANNNALEEVTIPSASNIVSLDLSNNKISTISLANLKKLTNLNLNNNNLKTLDVSPSTLLTELNLEGTNVLKKNIIIYKNSSFNISEKNPLKLFTGKESTILSTKSSNTELVVNNENQVTSSTPGDYYVDVNYKHNVSETSNTYKVKNDVYVVGLKSNNERYEVIENEHNKFVYIENYDSAVDTDANIIGTNVLVEGKSEYTTIAKDTSTSGIYKLKLSRKDDDDTSVLTNFITVGLSSSDYVINKNTIILLNQDFDISKVAFKLTTSTSKISKSTNDDKTELYLSYEGNIFKTLSIVKLNTTKYKDYLSKEFIYDNMYSTDNITITNATTSITNRDNCGTSSEKCRILNIINKNNVIVRSYNIINLTSTEYNITDEYVLVLNKELNISNIDAKTGTIKIEGTDTVPLISVYYGDQFIKSIDVTKVTSKYDLSKDYIISLKEDYDDSTNSFNYTEPNFTLVNGLIDYVDNLLVIKAKLNNGTSSVTAKTYTISKINSLSIGNNFSINKLETKTLKPIVNSKNDYDASKLVTYSSSNTDIATVDSSGTINALKVGTVIITATTIDSEENNRLSSTVTVTVTDKKIVKYVVDDKIYTKYYDMNANIKLSDEYSKIGYTLKGYRDDDSVFYAVNSNYEVTKDMVTLTAIYEINTYNISYNLDGGAIGNESPKSGTYGSTVVILNPSKEGYSFNGWTVTGTGASLSDTSLIIGSSDIELKANWIPKTYTITFDANGGTLSNTTMPVTYGTKYGDLRIPAWDGYEFAGWYSDKTFTSQITKDTIFNQASNQTLYAKWTSWPTLNVDLNFGSSSQTLNGKYKPGSNITLEKPTRANYIFESWTVVSGDGKINGNVLTIGNENTEIKALWADEKVVVTFDSIGGTISTTSKAYEINSKYGNLPIPIKNLNIFIGWYTGKTGGSKIEETTIVKSSNHTIYARYQSLSEKITSSTGYDISSNIIFNIKEKTNLANQFNFGNGITKKIFNVNSAEKTSGNLATADKVKLYQNGKEIGSYEIVVKGDVTGTGAINVSDVAKLYQHLKGKINMSSSYIKAGNVVDSDSTIRINDVAKLYQYVKGNIKEL